MCLAGPGSRLCHQSLKRRSPRAFRASRAVAPEKLYTLKDADIAAARKLLLDL